jgi:hypothetical protein
LVEGALSYKVTPGSKRSCDDVSGLADESFGRHMSWPLWIWVRPAGDAAVQILAAVGWIGADGVEFAVRFLRSLRDEALWERYSSTAWKKNSRKFAPDISGCHHSGVE